MREQGSQNKPSNLDTLNDQIAPDVLQLKKDSPAENGHENHGLEAGYSLELPGILEAIDLEIKYEDGPTDLPSDIEAIAVTDSPSGKQELMGVIGSSDVYFGIVRCSSVAIEPFLTLTRITNQMYGESKGSILNRITPGGGGNWHIPESIAVGEDDLDGPVAGNSPSFTIFNGPINNTFVINKAGKPLKVTVWQLSDREGHEGSEGGRSSAIQKDLLELNGWQLSDNTLLQAKNHMEVLRWVNKSFEGSKYSTYRSDLEKLLAIASTLPLESREVMLTGTLKGQRASWHELARSDRDQISQRLYITKLCALYPLTAETLIANQITGIHGTRSSTLGSALQFSGGKLLASEILIDEEGRGLKTFGGDAATAGSKHDRIAFSFLSPRGVRTVAGYAGADHPGVTKTLTDLENERDLLLNTDGWQLHDTQRMREHGAALNNAIAYIRSHPDSEYAALTLNDFPVIFGINAKATFNESIQGGNLLVGASNLDEFRPLQGELAFGTDISVIAVPRTRIAQVENSLLLFGHQTMAVLPIEDLIDDRVLAPIGWM